MKKQSETSITKKGFFNLFSSRDDESDKLRRKLLLSTLENTTVERKNPYIGIQTR